jgi:Flp pilus assembly pilin Flp
VIRFWKDEEGLTTVEYALLLALLVVAALGVWTAFGTQMKSTVNNARQSIANAAG